MLCDITKLAKVIEFCDSSFPIGSFNFSNGLESAATTKVVHNAETLESFTRSAVLQNINCDAIAALIAFRAANDNNYEMIIEADSKIFLNKISEESRQMSVKMGKKTAEISLLINATPLMSKWLHDIERKHTYGTFPISQALLFYVSDLNEESLFTAIEYGTINMILNAALRCIKVSHKETQTILYKLCTLAHNDYQRIKEYSFNDMQSFTPELDILASIHENGTNRMFMN